MQRTSLLHGPVINPGRNTFCQRCKHCTSERPGSTSAIFFQFLPPLPSTAALSFSSSSPDHFLDVRLPGIDVNVAGVDVVPPGVSPTS